jgi:hypothetical protein
MLSGLCLVNPHVLSCTVGALKSLADEEKREKTGKFDHVKVFALDEADDLLNGDARKVQAEIVKLKDIRKYAYFLCLHRRFLDVNNDLSQRSVQRMNVYVCACLCSGQSKRARVLGHKTGLEA